MFRGYLGSYLGGGFLGGFFWFFLSGQYPKNPPGFLGRVGMSKPWEHVTVKCAMIDRTMCLEKQRKIYMTSPEVTIYVNVLCVTKKIITLIFFRYREIYIIYCITNCMH